jgi:hypothetical protein
VALEVEGVVDGGVDTEEVLRIPGEPVAVTTPTGCRFCSLSREIRRRVKLGSEVPWASTCRGRLPCRS